MRRLLSHLKQVEAQWISALQMRPAVPGATEIASAAGFGLLAPLKLTTCGGQPNGSLVTPQMKRAAGQGGKPDASKTDESIRFYY